MKKNTFLFFLCIATIPVSAQRGFKYYRDSSRVGSAKGNAYQYFKKAYYDCIWKWTTAGADSAEYYLKLAVQEDPDYAAAYAFLAHVYQFKTYDSQHWDSAFALQKKYAQKAMGYQPRTGDAYSVMADVVWTEHDTLQTFSLLRKAIDMEPDNVGNYFWIAIRFRQMKQEKYYDSAVANFHRVMELDPEYGQAYLKLGNVYQLDKHINDSAVLYYKKAIDIYWHITPRDNRMMDAYYWLGEVYKSEHQPDSAVHYYKLLLKEMEPSDMYIRNMRLSSVYKALYECQQAEAAERLHQLLSLNETRIAADSAEPNLLFEILEGTYMTIDVDSVQEKYALPLARRIQAIRSHDLYVRTFAVDDEFLILKKLKRNGQALRVLAAQHTKEPEEPLMLFELGRMKCLANDNAAGIALLQKSKQHLNTVFNKQVFIDQLQQPDFDKLRSTAVFKKLFE